MATPLRDRRVLGGLALLLLCFLAATGARVLNVPDEGRYAEVAREMLRSGDFLTPRLDGVPFLDKPPLFYWLEAGALGLFGVHVWSARLVPALLGFAGCALVYAAGARLYGRRAGALAALVLAANPYYFIASQYVNHDLAVATWISAALLAFAVADHQDGAARARTLYAAYAAVGLAILTKGLIGVVLPVAVVGLSIAIGGRWRDVPRARLPTGLALAAAIAVPWHLLAARSNPDLLHYLYVVQHFQRFAATGFNNAKGPLFYPLVLAGGLLPWTPLLPGAVARALRAWRADPERNRSELLLLVWPAVVVLFFSIPASKIAGYVLPALPPLALLLGRHLDEAITHRERPAALLAAAAVVALAGLALLAAPLLPPWVPDARAMPAALLAAISAAGAVSVAAAALAVRWWRRAQPGRAAVALATFVAAFLAVGLPAVPYVTRDSSLPLVDALRPLLRAGDVVATYRRYYYDLPVYLDADGPILVADDWDDPLIPSQDNWRNELWKGRLRDPRSERWLLSRAELAARCAGARCFVLTHHDRVDEVRASMGLEIVARAGRDALLGPPDAVRAAAAR